LFLGQHLLASENPKDLRLFYLCSRFVSTVLDLFRF
jgi:hypothetical protein